MCFSSSSPVLNGLCIVQAMSTFHRSKLLLSASLPLAAFELEHIKFLVGQFYSNSIRCYISNSQLLQ